jgi:hypothetical protein
MCLALGPVVEPATTVQSCAGFCMSREVCHELGYLQTLRGQARSAVVYR